MSAKAESSWCNAAVTETTSTTTTTMTITTTKTNTTNMTSMSMMTTTMTITTTTTGGRGGATATTAGSVEGNLLGPQLFITFLLGLVHKDTELALLWPTQPLRLLKTRVPGEYRRACQPAAAFQPAFFLTCGFIFGTKTS